MVDLTEGKEGKVLLAFFLPILAGNLFQQLYLAADSAIIGNFLGKDSLAAVGFSYQLNILLLALSMGITLGTSVLVSKGFGAKQPELVKKAIDTGFLFSFVLSCGIAGIGFLCSKSILIAFRVPMDILELADIYLKIIFLGVIPSFAYNTITNILRGIGDSKAPTYILIGASFLNILLDLLAIIVFKWGVGGAALATVISQTVSFLCCMGYMKKRYPHLSIRFFHLQLDRAVLKQSLGIGTPAMLQQVFVSVGFLVIQFLINGFGTNCMAAYAAASKIDSFAQMPALNLGKAMTNFTAQNLGAKKKERVIGGGKAAVAIGCGISLAVSIVIFMFPAFFMGLFNSDPEVVQIGNSYLRIVPPFYIIFAGMQICNGLLLGYGKTMIPMLASVLSLCLMQVPAAILLSGTALGYCGIWIAAPIGWLGGFLIRSLYFRHILREKEV